MSKTRAKNLLSFAILTCGIHEHLLKTFFWSQECGLAGQDLPDITAVFTATFNYHK